MRSVFYIYIFRMEHCSRTQSPGWYFSVIVSLDLGHPVLLSASYVAEHSPHFIIMILERVEVLK